MDSQRVLQIELAPPTNGVRRMGEREDPRLTCRFLSEQPSGCWFHQLRGTNEEEAAGRMGEGELSSVFGPVQLKCLLGLQVEINKR